MAAVDTLVYTPVGMLAAVQQFLQEKEAEVSELLRSRDDDLSGLYKMVSPVIRGKGFAEIPASFDRQDLAESGDATFKDEYVLKEGLEARHIKLPILSAERLKAVYPAPRSVTGSDLGQSRLVAGRMEVDEEADSPLTPQALPTPPNISATSPPASAPSGDRSQQFADQHLATDVVDDPSQPSESAEEPRSVDRNVVIPDYSLTPVYANSRTYTPRVVRAMETAESGDDDEDILGQQVLARANQSALNMPWVGKARNPAVFEPSYHPLLFPPAATGDPAEGVDTHPYGQAATGVDTDMEHDNRREVAVQDRQRRLDDLVPLESSYASNLHPLPGTLTNTLNRHAHKHHHGQHRRDRRRSSLSGNETGASGLQGGVGQTRQLPKSLTAGGVAWALPPSYIPSSSRRITSMDPSELQAQNQELYNQRADREREEVDLVELGVTLDVNPAGRHINKGNKCMMSSDWHTVWKEIQFTRAMERVERLKDQGAWSFRQAKKFKGPFLPKGHWDYLLDETRWMQADFKEERRWKIAAARNLAQAVRTWHKGSKSEKAAMTIGNREWGVLYQHIPLPQQPFAQSSMVGHGPVVSEADQADQILDGLADRQREVDFAIMNECEAEKLDDNEEDLDMDAEGEEDAEGEKDEEMEEAADLDEQTDAVGNADIEMAADDAPDRKPAELAATVNALHGQGQTRVIPSVAGLDGTLHAGEETPFNEILPAIRKPLLDAEASETSVGLEELLEQTGRFNSMEMPVHVTIDDLFPDLSLYAAPDALEVHGERRADESAGRLAHTTRLMDIKPVIISSVQPGQTRRPDASWDEVGFAFFHPPEDDIEEIRIDPAQFPAPIFEGKKARPVMEMIQNRAPEQPRNAASRTGNIMWEEQDDAILLRLLGDYAWNWTLVADLFNSARSTVSTDRRSAWDCYYRWDHKWGPASKTVVPAQPAAPEAPLTPAQQELQQARERAQALAIANHAQGTLPGGIAPPMLARVASISGSVVNGAGDEVPDSALPASPGAGARKEVKNAKEARYTGSKKKVRNTTMRDAVRRSQKRRETNKKNAVRDTVNGKQIVTIHDSHTPFLSPPGADAPTPQDLSARQHELVLQEQEAARNRRMQDLRMHQLAQQNRLQQIQQAQQAQQAQQVQQQQQQQQQQQSAQQQQQMAQNRTSLTPQMNAAGSTPNAASSAPLANTPNQVARQPPTPGAAQQIAMQHSQLVNQTLQAAQQQQVMQQAQHASGSGNSGGSVNRNASTPMPPPMPSQMTPQMQNQMQQQMQQQHQQPRAQISGQNVNGQAVITLPTGQRLTVAPQGQGSPNANGNARLPIQAQQMGQQRLGLAGGPNNQNHAGPSTPVQAQANGGPGQASPNLHQQNGQSITRPSSNASQSSVQGQNMSNRSPQTGGPPTPRVGPGSTPANAGPSTNLPHGPPNTTLLIQTLLQRAGISSVNNIPIPPKPDGGNWSPQEVTAHQMGYLQKLATQHIHQNQTQRAAASNTKAPNPTPKQG